MLYGPSTANILGQYSVGVPGGFGNSSTAGELFQFRWTSSSAYAVIQRVSVSAVASAVTGSASAFWQMDMTKATSWTVQGTGGIGVDLSGGTCKRRATMPTSLVASGDIRYGSVPLGAGTKTLEANSLRSMLLPTASANILYPVDVFAEKPGDNECPLILATNEGFVLRYVVASASGGVQASINVDWCEVTTWENGY